MARPVKDGISLLIGAGIGVGLMYLLDPEVGADRRAKLSKSGKDGLSGLSDLASDFAASGMGGLSGLKGKLADAYESLNDHLHDHVDHAKSVASDVVSDAKSKGDSAVGSAQDRLSALKADLLSKLSNKAGELSGPAKAKYAKLLRDKTLELGRSEDHHYVGQTACALSSLAIGAGLVYFLDTDKGHDRRDKMTDVVSSSVQEIGDFFRRLGTRLIHRGQDVAQQASEKFDDVRQQASELKDQYLGDDASESDVTAQAGS